VRMFRRSGYRFADKNMRQLWRGARTIVGTARPTRRWGLRHLASLFQRFRPGCRRRTAARARRPRPLKTASRHHIVAAR